MFFIIYIIIQVMPPKKSLKNTCKSPGYLVFIGGKEWCVGEKLSSKNPRSPLNKKKNKTRRKYKNK